MNIAPKFDKVIVRQQAKEEKSEGGVLHLPDDGEQQNRGEVVAVGPGKLLNNGEHFPVQVAVGDKIIFSAYATGNPITHEGETLLVMDESQILAVVE